MFSDLIMGALWSDYNRPNLINKNINQFIPWWLEAGTVFIYGKFPNTFLRDMPDDYLIMRSLVSNKDIGSLCPDYLSLQQQV